MPENFVETKNNESPNAETNLNCGRDVRIVTDGEMLEDGIVEITDKKEYIDEP
jgi:hypothetical protein